ncbi:MAG: PEP-CTERM sorting domain-containing protein [Smithella sp.]
MGRLRVNLLALALLIGFFFLYSSACAYPLTSIATANVGEVKIALTNTSGMLNVTSATYTQVHAYATASNPGSIDDHWTGTILNNGGGTSAAVSNAYAIANVSYTSTKPNRTNTTYSNGIKTITTAEASVSSVSSHSTYASAYGWTSAYNIWFSLLNPATLTISVPYSLYAESNSKASRDDTWASLLVRLWGPGNTVLWIEKVSNVNGEITLGHYNGSWSWEQGVAEPTLERSLEVTASGLYHIDYDIHASAFSNVPIPSALILLGSGLFGLANLRRKFCK